MILNITKSIKLKTKLLPRTRTITIRHYLKDKELNDYEPDRIRNFSIIAHIDHGKSTLADRLLELSGTIDSKNKNKQFLDKLQVEKTRGITVKAQSATMFYKYKGVEYMFNLIDTPGHVDFSYEVSRSLSACQGTILLVDACQGIQAQTVANFYLAFGMDLVVIPILNKIDSALAQVDNVKEQLLKNFDIQPESVLQISAKTGLNVDSIFGRIINDVPSPIGNRDEPFKALLFDSWYDNYVGAVCLVAVIDGKLSKGDKIVSYHCNNKYEVAEVGIMFPNQTPTNSIFSGQVGYITMNMKDPRDAKIGDTFYKYKEEIAAPLSGFVPAKPMVFSGLYPFENSEFVKLEESIAHLILNDSSVSIQRETSLALGQGWRLGFLGTLHMDVFKQRLLEEYNASVIITQPTVPFQVLYKDGSIVTIKTPADFPEEGELSNKVEDLKEPMTKCTLIFPTEFMGAIMDLVRSHRAEEFNQDFLDDQKMILKCVIPLSEIVIDFYDKLKSRSSGYASFDYEDIGCISSDLVKMTVLINSKPVDVLTRVLHRSQSEKICRDLVKKLKDVIERQSFEVIIQTAIGNKIIARERIPPYRKNVTAKCYGGDQTRKNKLLDKQKEGKKRMKSIGNVQLPQEAFYSLMEIK